MESTDEHSSKFKQSSFDSWENVNSYGIVGIKLFESLIVLKDAEALLVSKRKRIKFHGTNNGAASNLRINVSTLTG